MKQLSEGRAEVENQYGRVVPYDGNPDGAEGARRRLRAASVLRVAGPRLHRPFGAGAVAATTRSSTPSCATRYRAYGSRTRRPASAARCSRGAEALGMQGFRDRVYAGDAHRHLHGVLRRRLRGVLQLWPVRQAAAPPGGADVPRTFTEDQVGERIEAMRRRAPRFRDERITMAHGAGGKASRALVEGLIVPLLDNPALAQLSDAGAGDGGRYAAGDDNRRLRGATAALPGWLDRGARGQRHGERPCRVRGPAAGALRRPVLEEGLTADVLEAEIRAMAEASTRADVPVITGDTKVVERGKLRLDIHHHDRHRAARPRRRGRAGPGAPRRQGARVGHHR